MKDNGKMERDGIRTINGKIAMKDQNEKQENNGNGNGKLKNRDEKMTRKIRWIWKNCKQCFNYSVCYSMAWMSEIMQRFERKIILRYGLVMENALWQ